MAKVVFCNIAWMKLYSGITDNDQPKNGGAFVKENNDACESFNFYPYNHYCLGYVRAPGQRLNLARVEDVPDYVNKIDDVTVIWVATNDTGRHIVGWYEHAEMYRYYQEFYDSVNGVDRCWCYNFAASEKDVYLIPEELRNFRILSASKAGAGLGMGQSNLWYADSVITKEKFVPKVLEYLEKIRPQTIQQHWRTEEIERIADIQGKSFAELDELAVKADSFDKKIAIDNLIIAMNPQNIFKARYQRAVDLDGALLYDEAIEEYQRALACATDADEKSDMFIDCMFNLLRLLDIVRKFFLAWEVAKRCLAIAKTIEDKFIAIDTMLRMSYNEGNIELVEQALGYYDDLKTDYGIDIIRDYKKWLKEQKKNKK